MDGQIRLLSDAVANQIAAGEVVQRPASVVKELLENAVDAGANDIVLKIVDAGKTLIQVIDNGKGMGPADAKMCFERHATSKIAETKDIFNILTKGFRGEALASIAAIAQVELSTRRHDAEVGEILKVEGSVFGESKVTACPTGTSVSVKNLFFNVPARRKFLKSDNVENKHIIDEYLRVALAHPNIAFKYIQNEKTVYNNNKGNIKQRIVQLMGASMEEKLAPIAEETNLFKLSGFIVKPNAARKTRGDQYIFVNNRFIKSNYLHHAINNAYEGLLDKESHPGYYLFFEMDPASIDINIHPTKTEIKFEDERSIYQLLKSIVKRSLGIYNLAPSIDFTNLTGMEFTPVSNRSQGNSNYTNPNSLRGRQDQSFDTPKEAMDFLEDEGRVKLTDDELAFSKEMGLDTNAPTESQSLAFTEDVPVQSLSVFGKYLMLMHGETLLCIDVKRAQQRIIFEKFSHSNSEISAQGALFDEVITVPESEQQLLNPYLDTLKSMGISIESFGKDAMVLRTVPSDFTMSSVAELLETFINELKHSENINQNGIRDIMAKRLALANSLHFKISENKNMQKHFVDALFACENCSLSPFGKNVFKQFDAQSIDKLLQ